MSAMASQITGVSTVYSTVCSGADQRKHQSSFSTIMKFRGTALCEGNSPVTGEFPAQRASNAENCFHMMTSSCSSEFQWVINVVAWCEPKAIILCSCTIALLQFISKTCNAIPTPYWGVCPQADSTGMIERTLKKSIIERYLWTLFINSNEMLGTNI